MDAKQFDYVKSVALDYFDNDVVENATERDFTFGFLNQLYDLVEIDFRNVSSTGFRTVSRNRMMHLVRIMNDLGDAIS